MINNFKLSIRNLRTNKYEKISFQRDNDSFISREKSNKTQLQPKKDNNKGQ